MHASERLLGGNIEPTLGLGDPLPSWQQRYGALATCAVLVLGTVVASWFGHRQGPVIPPLVPITATIWCLADMLTAFLLLAQFYVNGRISFGILTAGYAFSGLLTCPYVIAFPGLFLPPATTTGQQSISVYLWIVWHCVFPLCVILSVLNDSTIKRIVSRRAILGSTIAAVIAPIVLAGITSALIIGERNALPNLVIDGHFTATYENMFVPLVIGCNVVGCTVLLLRRSRVTTLQLWLCTAMFSACLDAVMQLSATRYSFAWDAGKAIAVFTASIVLVMVLCEIAGLYGRLAQAARIDPLTMLPNRRAFEDHLQLIYHNAVRTGTSMAMLVIDIDFFKRYNDSYGHLAGDECLRAVARELTKSATRPLDIIARYGGEEFVAVLPDTPLQGVFTVAEQIRSLVESLAVDLGSSEPGRVTVSIGVGFAPNGSKRSASEIFEAADRGLYQSKKNGRNRVTLGSTLNESFPASARPEAPVAVAIK